MAATRLFLPAFSLAKAGFASNPGKGGNHNACYYRSTIISTILLRSNTLYYIQNTMRSNPIQLLKQRAAKSRKATSSTSGAGLDVRGDDYVESKRTNGLELVADPELLVKSQVHWEKMGDGMDVEPIAHAPPVEDFDEMMKDVNAAPATEPSRSVLFHVQRGMELAANDNKDMGGCAWAACLTCFSE